MKDAFEEATYGARSIGWGERPALLIVDFQRGFTDPAFTMGRSGRVHAARDATVPLADAARTAGLPVASCCAGWQSDKDIQHWKVEALHHEFFVGSEALAIDPLILDPAYDFTFMKCAPSMFFQTPIVPFLTRHMVDTVIIAGCVTSGCVRATAIDAFSYGFRTIVVDDCCGDPEAASHEANLRDISRRYADIEQSDAVIEKIGARA